MGHNVFVVNSCICDSKDGYKKSIQIWEKFLEKENKNNFINRFNLRKMNISLIKTRSWKRNLLNSDEEENIFREAKNIMELYDIDFVIGWGNLLLEESIYKEAKIKKIKICFYLVNPTYKGKKTFLLENSDLVITDSEATRNLYSNELKCKTIIISKSLDEKYSQAESEYKSQISKKCLLINPSLEKGLEPLLILSDFFDERKNNISFICIDGRNRFKDEINYLKKKEMDIPSNVLIYPAIENLNNLFANIRVLLLLSIWHESGSRLILESYERGIPVIAFDTGGNSEIMKNYPEDIFEKPLLYRDKNNRLMIQSWDIKKIYQRISYLCENEEYYKNYSAKIKSENKPGIINKKFRKSLLNFLEIIKKDI